jgi:DNA-binding transcriptional MerR regulator
MNATKPIQNDSMPPYKKLLLQAQEMRGQSNGMIYDRARILCQVFDDGEFREDNGNIDDFRLAEILNNYIDDLGFDFLDLRSMLDKYPDRESWVSGRLKRMLAAIREKRESPVRRATLRIPITETRKQLSRQLENLKREKTIIASSKTDEIIRLKDRIAELEEEVERLTRENAELRAIVNRQEQCFALQ